jgi:hypothetical protein
MSVLSSMYMVKFVRATWSLGLVHESFESYTPLSVAFCVAHHALLNVEFVIVS